MLLPALLSPPLPMFISPGSLVSVLPLCTGSEDTFVCHITSALLQGFEEAEQTKSEGRGVRV